MIIQPSKGLPSRSTSCSGVLAALRLLSEGNCCRAIALPSDRIWTTEELDAVEDLANRAEAVGVDLVITRPIPDLCLQLDRDRLHRRLLIESRSLPALDEFRTEEQRDPESMAVVLSFREDPEHVTEMLSQGTVEAARDLFQWVLRAEDELYAQNLVQPYLDIVPTVLRKLGPERIALILEGLSPGYAARTLCDDYTRVESEVLGAIVKQMHREFSGKVLRAMVGGRDRPRRLAAILRCAGSDAARGLFEFTDAKVVLKLVDASERSEDARWILRQLSDSAFEELLTQVNEARQGALRSARAQSQQAGDSPPDPREAGWDSSSPLDSVCTAVGLRRVSKVGTGRWAHIEEILDGPNGPKRVLVDTLELEPSEFELRCTSSDRDLRPTVADCAQLFPEGSGPPDEQSFRKAGLFRLQERARNAGAVAAINGNFYFDYGHYANGHILGFECEKVPGLKFGDPIGWYVENGRELTPPVLNRCAFVVTADGRPWIGRTKMTALVVDGVRLDWAKENAAAEVDEIVLYTPLWGKRTPSSPDRIAYGIAGHSVETVNAGGDAVIPFTGFVLSIPRSAGNWHHRLESAQNIEFLNDFPDSRGAVKQAMACGPQLVRNGEIEIDFALEEFGTKDSTVMSFFLPRLADRYEAARSFIAMTKWGSLILGTISGRAFGYGGAGQPSGVTFGEMALLARDLGAESAMGLDGGGSSSLIADLEGELSVLNVPTGGADVPRGGERFIANGLLVHSRRGSGDSSTCS